MLEKLFKSTLLKYTQNIELINEYWIELESLYNSNKRYYHNLNHLENLYKQLELVKDQIEDWDSILFALFYHDAIYNTLKNDNEEKSADLAVTRLRETSFPEKQIQRCYSHILATKSHQLSMNNDCNLFTDADLSILASKWETYQGYSQKIRKEYKIYPKLIYNKGRKKVLNHLLNQDKLYKTDFFFFLYEEKARTNLKKELTTLI
ncbi:HD domain-containing protein [Pseudofulvibacter geojedonensis]|uniref:Metal-dependent HD superfamily phosphohydrolase n=1 Tax=Pseudofulvibacter geojedonensis TaxID=1123758 RepID=A0ABW3HZ44_9FLAO